VALSEEELASLAATVERAHHAQQMSARRPAKRGTDAIFVGRSFETIDF